jgi:hypothetical protein
VIGQEYAVAATASHNTFDWLYRTAQMVHRFRAERKPCCGPDVAVSSLLWLAQREAYQGLVVAGAKLRATDGFLSLMVLALEWAFSAR